MIGRLVSFHKLGLLRLVSNIHTAQSAAVTIYWQEVDGWRRLFLDSEAPIVEILDLDVQDTSNRRAEASSIV
jgi:hypothetical protein